jgi:hypothetical protein
MAKHVDELRAEDMLYIPREMDGEPGERWLKWHGFIHSPGT